MRDAQRGNSLQNLQMHIIDQLFDAQFEVVSAIVDTPALDSAARMQIYRHNVYANLTSALGALYPVVKRIVGDDFFQEMARCYVQETPSLSGDLNQYGVTFPEYIAGYPYAVELPYLPDVASLEWYWHVAFHAENCIAIDAAAFQIIAAENAEKWSELKFDLAASVKLLTSPYPLLQIWLAHQDNDDNRWEIDWSATTSYFLISRVHTDVVIRELSYAESVFLNALRAKTSLQHSLDAAAMAAAHMGQSFDLQQTLYELLEASVFSQIQIPEV